MNPELVRNLWVELTPRRILVALFVLGSVFALAWASMQADGRALARVALWAYYLIVLLWGPRQAALTLADEVADRTWDTQRMSALGPWQMAWGKLAGGTSFVWFCAGIALAIWAVMEPMRPVELGRHLLGGVAAMLAAFLVTLLQMRRLRSRTRLRSWTGAAVGTLIGFLISPVGVDVAGTAFTEPGLRVAWYGMSFAADRFVLVSQLLFTLWLLLGVYRTMRAELQKPTWPWGWAAFTLYLCAYVTGFVVAADPLAGSDSAGLWPLATAATALFCFYVGLFADRKDGIRYHWLVASLKSGDHARALRLTPIWLPGLAIAAVSLGLLAGFVRFAPGAAYPFLSLLHGMGTMSADIASEMEEFAGSPGRWALAMLFFLLRDLMIVLWANFSPRARMPDLAAFLYLWVLYHVLPSLVAMTIGVWALGLVLPWTAGLGWIAVLAPALQAAAMGGFAWWRWRSLAPRQA